MSCSLLMAFYAMPTSHASQRQEQHWVYINWRQQLPIALAALSTDGKFPESSQVEFNPQTAGTGLACLLERELAEAEYDGKRICTKLGTPATARSTVSSLCWEMPC